MGGATPATRWGASTMPKIRGDRRGKRPSRLLSTVHMVGGTTLQLTLRYTQCSSGIQHAHALHGLLLALQLNTCNSNKEHQAVGRQLRVLGVCTHTHQHYAAHLSIYARSDADGARVTTCWWLHMHTRATNGVLFIKK